MKKATAWIDGGGNTGTPCTCGCIFRFSARQEIEAARVVAGTTNNEAEYEGLILALNLAIKFEVETLHVLSDSQLIVNQMNGVYGTRKPHLQHYLAEARQLASQIPSWTLQWIPRNENKRADALCRNIRGFPLGTYWERPARPPLKPRKRPGGPLKKKQNPFASTGGPWPLPSSDLDSRAWGKFPPAA